jgi:hypothetical protein
LVLAALIAASRVEKSALDRIVVTDLVGNMPHSLCGSRVIAVLPTYFGPPTRQNFFLAKRRDISRREH